MADYDFYNQQPIYANLSDGGREVMPAGAWSSQFGGDGLNAPFYPVSEPVLQNMQPISPVPYFEPVAVGQGPERQPATRAGIGLGEVGARASGQEFIAVELPMMHNTIVDYWSPKSPTRYDHYSQSYQLPNKQVYAGTSPQRGLYTGIEDM